MENTIENKEKFFAQYFGQKVCYWSDGEVLCDVGEVIRDYYIGDFCLRTTPLQDITDEDAIEVASFVYADITDGDETILFAKNYIMYSFGGWNTNKFEVEQFSLFRDEYVCQQTIDYLRSKGYLIPFGGKSVEEILKLGWVRYEND
jgi:hypothetical protein